MQIVLPPIPRAAGPESERQISLPGLRDAIDSPDIRQHYQGIARFPQGPATPWYCNPSSHHSKMAARGAAMIGLVAVILLSAGVFALLNWLVE